MIKVNTYREPTFAFTKWDWEKDPKHKRMLSQGWKVTSLEEVKGTDGCMMFILVFALFPWGWLFVKKPMMKVTYNQ